VHGSGGLLNGGDDAWMGSTAADISLQGLYDFRLTGIGIFLQERDAADNHSGSAIGALECALIEKGLLHRMELAVLLESFDGGDGFSGGVADRELAGAARRAIEQNGAGAALAFAATVFCSGEAKLFAQSKQQSCVGAGNENPAFSVDLRVDGPCHWSSKRRAIAGVVCKFILRLAENEHKSRESAHSGVLNAITMLGFLLRCAALDEDHAIVSRGPIVDNLFYLQSRGS
jgi:hypothetical protein